MGPYWKSRMRRVPRACPIVAICLLFAGCAPFESDRTAEVARTWEASRAHLPGSAVALQPSTVQPPGPALPTVLYMHGCSGIAPNDFAWATTLSQSGYAAVLPDSWARRGRPSACKQVSYQVFDMRDEEIRYALAQLRLLPWVDQRNLFLMGHSEGGGATALWEGGGFNGHVISGWSCTHSQDSSLDGIKAPLRTPILAVTFMDDPYLFGWLRGSCDRKFGARKSAREVKLPGTGHNTAGALVAEEAVLDFLRRHTIR